MLAFHTEWAGSRAPSQGPLPPSHPVPSRSVSPSSPQRGADCFVCGREFENEIRDNVGMELESQLIPIVIAESNVDSLDILGLEYCARSNYLSHFRGIA